MTPRRKPNIRVPSAEGALVAEASVRENEIARSSTDPPRRSAKPRPKVNAVWVTGSLTTVVAFVLVSLHVDVPEPVVAAAVTLVVTAAAYIKKEE